MTGEYCKPLEGKTHHKRVEQRRGCNRGSSILLLFSGKILQTPGALNAPTGRKNHREQTTVSNWRDGWSWSKNDRRKPGDRFPTNSGLNPPGSSMVDRIGNCLQSSFYPYSGIKALPQVLQVGPPKRHHQICWRCFHSLASRIVPQTKIQAQYFIFLFFETNGNFISLRNKTSTKFCAHHTFPQSKCENIRHLYINANFHNGIKF